MKTPKSILTTVSAMALGAGGTVPTLAQEEVADAQIETLEVIIVSARKRDERLQDVPVSIAAFSGPALEREGIENVVDLYGSVPSLYFAANPLSPGRDFQFLTIRGVGANSQLEPSTATFVDGVYLPSLGFDTDFLSLERVEVLRGPQGTLFGRNTQGGALNIVTQKPGATFGGKAILELDEFNSVKVGATMDVPLAEDKLFANLTGQYSYTDGFIDNTSLDTHADSWRKFAGRASFLFLPSDNVEVTLRLDGSNGKGNSAVPGVPAGCDCYEISSEFQDDQKVINWGGSLSIVADLDNVELTAITGYRKLENDMPFDFDGSDEFINNRHDLKTEQSIFSQEIRLASTNDSNFTWIAGLYGYDESLFSDRQYGLFDLDTFFDDITNRQTVETDRKGWAAFGQATLTIADKIDITGGLRYSVEKVENATDVEFAVPPIAFTGAFLAEDEETFKDLSPMGSVAVRWTDQFMTYATVAKGFKGGGFDRAPVSALNVRAVNEETSVNYELGFKSSLLNNRLTLDFAVFRVNIRDQQLQSIVIVDDVPFSAIDNAGESHTQGIEFSAAARLSDSFKIDGNFGYTKSEFDSYVDATGADRAGDAFPYVPEVTAAFGAEYRRDIGENKELSIRASYRYVDSYFIGTGAAFDPRFELDSYDIVNLRATVSGENWEVTLFADNLFDSYVVTNRFNAFFFAGDRINLDTLSPPRRFGIRTSFHF